MRISVSTAALGAALLWIVAASLLTYDTFTPGTAIGRWGIFASAAAATSTVCLSMRHCRRVILEVMSWEHWMIRERDDDARRSNVRAIR
jgi:hypothetical protein